MEAHPILAVLHLDNSSSGTATPRLKVTHIRRGAIGGILANAAADAGATSNTPKNQGFIDSSREGVWYREVLLPAHLQKTPGLKQLRHPYTLWKTANLSDGPGNPVVAREFTARFPPGLDPRQQLTLARWFSQTMADQFKTAVDFTIHGSGIGKEAQGSKKREPYASILMPTRELTSEGFGKKFGRKTVLERREGTVHDPGVDHYFEEINAIKTLWSGMTKLLTSNPDILRFVKQATGKKAAAGAKVQALAVARYRKHTQKAASRVRGENNPAQNKRPRGRPDDGLGR